MPCKGPPDCDYSHGFGLSSFFLSNMKGDTWRRRRIVNNMEMPDALWIPSGCILMHSGRGTIPFCLLAFAKAQIFYLFFFVFIRWRSKKTEKEKKRVYSSFSSRRGWAGKSLKCKKYEWFIMRCHIYIHNNIQGHSPYKSLPKQEHRTFF